MPPDQTVDARRRGHIEPDRPHLHRTDVTARTAAFWMAVTPAILVPAHCIGLDITGPIGLLGLGTSGWLVFACGLCWKSA